MPLHPTTPSASGQDDLFGSAIKLAEAIRRRGVSCVEVAQESLRRIERLNGDLGAFITVDGEGAVQAATRLDVRLARGDPVGPLCGVPMAIKDNIATQDLRTTGGTSLFAHWIPDRDAAVVQALRAAGAVIVGKANLHEAAIGVTSLNPHFGAVRNPHDAQRLAGGSSGGSAVAVVAGLCAASLGSDTGGSVRVPAALCGCVGFKPSLGRVPTDGLMSLSKTCDVIGPITHDVGDAAELFAVVSGRPSVSGRDAEPRSLRGLKVGLASDALGDTSAEVEAVLQDVLHTLSTCGGVMTPVQLSDVTAAMSTGFSIVKPEAWVLLEELLGRVAPQLDLTAELDHFGEDVHQFLAAEAHGGQPAHEYLVALWRLRPRIRAAFERAFTTCDVILTATTPMVAPPVSEHVHTTIDGRPVPTFEGLCQNTVSASVAGLPAITLPAGVAGGQLPVGLQLIGPEGQDEALLRAAAAFEAVLGGAGTRRPRTPL